MKIENKNIVDALYHGRKLSDKDKVDLAIELGIDGLDFNYELLLLSSLIDVFKNMYPINGAEIGYDTERCEISKKLDDILPLIKKIY